MKEFLMKLIEIVKKIRISDQVAGLVIMFTLCYLSFLAGIDWVKDQQPSHLSAEFSNSSCKLTPELQKLETMLEKVRGEQ